MAAGVWALDTVEGTDEVCESWEFGVVNVFKVDAKAWVAWSHLAVATLGLVLSGGRNGTEGWGLTWGALAKVEAEAQSYFFLELLNPCLAYLV